jgi:tryptophan-rich sensory protein
MHVASAESPSPAAAASQRSSRAQALVLAAFLVVCLAVEYVSSTVTRPAIEPWYRNLAKPSWTPPDLAFPIVWTVIFVLMAFAGWQAWRRSAPGTFAGPLAWFGVQLGLNLAWSVLFFGQGELLLALVDLIALFAALLVTTARFWRISRPAGLMLLPYVAWVCFAGALNFAVVRLN